jgi:hypothetical protein
MSPNPIRRRTGGGHHRVRRGEPQERAHARTGRPLSAVWIEGRERIEGLRHRIDQCRQATAG